jgi:hypothetical protein
MRIEYACLYLREVLPTALYVQVRTEVSKWNVESEDKERKSA